MHSDNTAEQKPRPMRAEDPKFIANCDQEAWVKRRIESAISMSLALGQHGHGHHEALALGVQGIVNGTAIAIINILGGEYEGANLPRHLPDGGIYSR